MRTSHAASSARPATAASIRLNASAHARSSSAIRSAPDRDRAGERYDGPDETTVVNPGTAQQRVELVERDGQAARRARRAAEQARHRVALGGSGGALGDRARTSAALARFACRSAIEHPGELGVAEEPVQPLAVDAFHSCGPSGGVAAATTGGGSGAGSTRMRPAPSHSQRLTSTAATPSIRESCAIASPGTSA